MGAKRSLARKILTVELGCLAEEINLSKERPAAGISSINDSWRFHESIELQQSSLA